MSSLPTTLPAALAALDELLADSAGLRARMADYRAECDNLYALLVQANAHSAALAVEFAQAHAEREQLRESLESTTALVAELTEERAALRRSCEGLATERDSWRVASS